MKVWYSINSLPLAAYLMVPQPQDPGHAPAINDLPMPIYAEYLAAREAYIKAAHAVLRIEHLELRAYHGEDVSYDYKQPVWGGDNGQ